MQTDEEKKTENNYDRCKTGDKKGWTVYNMSDSNPKKHTQFGRECRSERDP